MRCRSAAVGRCGGLCAGPSNLDCASSGGVRAGARALPSWGAVDPAGDAAPLVRVRPAPHRGAVLGGHFLEECAGPGCSRFTDGVRGPRPGPSQSVRCRAMGWPRLAARRDRAETRSGRTSGAAPERGLTRSSEPLPVRDPVCTAAEVSSVRRSEPYRPLRGVDGPASPGTADPGPGLRRFRALLYRMPRWVSGRQAGGRRDNDLLACLPRATGPRASVAFSDRSLLPSHAPGSHPVRVLGRVVWHFGREARLQGLSPLESPLPPGGGLDRPGPDALLGFQSLQGFPPHRLEPTLPSTLLSQAWRGPANR
jgi:hypothetical protein